MEKVHKAEFRKWISPPVVVKDFCQDWYARIPKSESQNSFALSYSESERSEVEEQCGLEALRCSHHHLLEVSKEVTIPEDVHLETLNFQNEDIEKQKADPQYEKMVYMQLKDGTFPKRKQISHLEECGKFLEVEHPDVLLRVQIYMPEARQNFQSMVTKCQVDQELMVLGSQFLTELRDKILCVSDRAVPGDYSEEPDQPLGESCGDLMKSGFFYINGVFYNDMRHPSSLDYSKSYIDWAKHKAKGVGPFSSARMEETRFVDLTLQLGYPYLYMHQGNCEHLIVFNDILVLSGHYSTNRFDYPMHVEVKPKRRTVCMVCRTHVAEWIVYDNKRLPVHPFFFCKPCFLSFNYKDRKKVGHFSAYHHFDRSYIL